VHPNALQNVLARYRSFVTAWRAQEPLPSGEVLSNVPMRTMTFGSYAVVLYEQNALAAYERLEKCFVREPWSKQWSESHIQDLLRSAIGKAMENDGAEQVSFDELAAELSLPAPSYTVIFPVLGVDLRVPELRIGSNRVFLMTESHATDLIAISTAICNELQNPPEEREGAILRSAEFITSLVNSTCVEIRTVGDVEQARRHAEIASIPIRDLLQLMAAVFEPKEKDIRIDIRPEARGFRPTIMLSSDKTHLQLQQSRFGGAWTLPITEQRVAQFRECGFDDLFVILGKVAEERTEIEEFIIRALHWFADAESQGTLENALLSLVTCLDMFFSSRDSQVTSLIQFGVAHLMGQDPADRERLFKFIGDVYERRSRASHEGEGLSTAAMASDTRILVLNFLAMILRRREEFKTKRDLREWVVKAQLRAPGHQADPAEACEPEPKE
jgi:hypothetical protein